MSKVFHNSFYAMGTRCSVVIPFDEEEICERLFKLIQTEVFRLENKLSYFNPGSDVAKINLSAFKHPVQLDDELFFLFNSCLEYYSQTFGAFDITVRPIIENLMLHNSLDNSQLDGGLLTDKIQIDSSLKNIRFIDERTKIDFGGVGKGYALERIKQIIKNSPVNNVFISFGESSILAVGKHPSGNQWPVGIKDFQNPEKSAYTFALCDSSISTSSNCYWDDSGRLIKKLNVINPFTQTAVNEFNLVSVQSKSPVQAEVFSTAFLILDDEQIEKAITGLNIEAVKICNEKNNQTVKVYDRKK